MTGLFLHRRLCPGYRCIALQAKAVLQRVQHILNDFSKFQSRKRPFSCNIHRTIIILSFIRQQYFSCRTLYTFFVMKQAVLTDYTSSRIHALTTKKRSAHLARTILSIVNDQLSIKSSPLPQRTVSHTGCYDE